jgi:long-chain acyl-CoA synthetase
LSDKGALYNFSCNDVYLSYLQLAHVFERTLLQIAISYGMSIGFYRGDISKIFDDAGRIFLLKIL